MGTLNPPGMLILIMRGLERIRYIIAVAIILLFTQSPGYAANRPVVVIPGVVGSKLCDASGNIVWGDRFSYSIDRLNKLRLPPDVKDRDTSIQSCGLIDTVSLIPLFWEANIYRGLIDYIKSLGYEDNEIHIFDYDWRLSNFYNAERLKKFISRITSRDRVDIIAHSMGGLVARVYIQKMGGRGDVNNLIMLATPHLGSAKIFERLQEGFEHWPNALSGGLSEIQSTILSFPSTYQLLPTYSDCCAFVDSKDQGGAKYFDVLDPKIWMRLDIPFSYKSGPYNESLVNNLIEAASLKKIMAEPLALTTDESERFHYVANGFLKTWSRVFFDNNTGRVIGTRKAEGDGTVILYSATNTKVRIFQGSSREHESIFLGKEAQLVLKTALSNHVWHSSPTTNSQNIISKTGMSIAISGAELEVTPRTSTPNEDLIIGLKLDANQSGKNLMQFDADVMIIGPDGTVTKIANPNIARSDRSIIIMARTKAPSATGVYTVQLKLPGIEIFEDRFAVFEK